MKNLFSSLLYFFIFFGIQLSAQSNITPTNFTEPFSNHFTYIDSDGKIRNETLDNTVSWLLTENKRIQSTVGGEINFTIRGSQLNQLIGFSSTQKRSSTTSTSNYLNYGIIFSPDGTYCSYRSFSNIKQCGTYNDHDKFTIKITNNTIHYIQNNTEFHSYPINEASYAMDMFIYESFDNINYIQNASLTNYEDNSIYNLKSQNNFVGSFSSINSDNQINRYYGIGSIESIDTFRDGILTFEPVGPYINGGIGLSKPNRIASIESVDFMIYFTGRSKTSIYESGEIVYSTSNDSYVSGDQFSIEIKKGQITYWKTSQGEKTLLYTSTKIAKGNYVMDSYLSSYYGLRYPLQNISFTDISEPTTFIPQSPYTNVYDFMDGTSSIDGGAVFAISRQSFSRNDDVYIEFKAGGDIEKGERMRQHVGLTGVPTTGYNGILLHKNSDQVDLVNIGSTSQSNIIQYTPNDIFRIEKIRDNIYYKKNGEIFHSHPFYTSDLFNNFKFGIASSDSNGYIDNIRIGFIEPKEPFEAKIIDPFYYFRKEADFSEIAKGLIDEEGRPCLNNENDNCKTKASVITLIKEGKYFYHVGVDGDKSFYNNSESENLERKALNDELVMLGSLLMNNTNSKQEYTIKANLPGDNIIIRREANVDGPKSKSLGYNEMTIIGDPLTRLIKENDEWRISLYPNEIVKLFIEFKSNYSLFNANEIYGLEIKTLTKNYKKQVNFDLEIINKFIPDQTDQMVFVEGYIDFDNFKFNSNYGITHLQHSGSSLPSHDSKGLRFNPDGSINQNMSDPNAITKNGSIGALLRYDFDRNFSRNLIVYFNNLVPGEGKKQSYFQTINNGVYIKEFSEEWINAYVNTLIYIEDYLNRNKIPLEKFILYTVDEGSIPEGLTTDVLKKLYERISNETNIKILQAFGNHYDDNTVTTLAPYLDYIRSSQLEFFTTYQHHFKNNVGRLAYVNNYARGDDGIELFRTRPLWSAMKFNTIAYDFVPSLRARGSWGYLNGVIGTTDTNQYNFFNVKECGNKEEIIANHWNPAAKDICDTTGDNNITFVPSIRVYASLQSNIDTKIYRYLKDLDTPSVTDQLKQLSSQLDTNISYKTSHQISNRLKELYNSNNTKNAIYAKEDAHVFKCKGIGCRGSEANLNYGKAVHLQISNTLNQGKLHQSYLKFDISNLTLSNDQKVELTLTFKETLDNGFTPAQIEVYEILSNDWAEEEITYNNQPVMNFINANNVNHLGSIPSSKIISSNQKIKLDITDFIKNKKTNGDNIVTIGLATKEQKPINLIYSKDISIINYKPHLNIFSYKTSSRKAEEITEKQTISFTVVYPNPTNDLVNVKAKKDVSNWRIINFSGKPIKREQFNTPKRNLSANIGDQPEGIYIIQLIYTDKTSESKKIVKK